jgi:hypothetical protein
MRLGDLVIFERAEPLVDDLAAPATGGERGFSGRSTYGGEATFGDLTDVNSKWRPPDRWRTVAKMRSDPDTSAAMDAVILPVLGRDLSVEPGARSLQAADIAAFIANDLNNMSTAWGEIRRAALDGALWDGTAPFETVWGYDNESKKYHLRKLAYRPPASVIRWREDDNGGPAGIVQQHPTRGEVTIDMDELLVFVRNQTKAGLVGEPLSRRMYGPWLIKDKLQLIGAQAVERHGLGIPTMLYKGNNPTVFAKLRQMLMSLHAGAKQYALLTDIESLDQFKIMGAEGKIYDALPQMEFHRRAIYLSTFTQFLPLGSSGGGGSRALGDSFLDAFFLMLRTLQAAEVDTYNRYLIPRWVRLNWAGVPESEYPKVVAAQLDGRDVAQWFAAVLSAVQAGITFDPSALKDAAYNMLGIDDEAAKEPVEALPQDAGETGEVDDVEPTVEAKGRKWTGARAGGRLVSDVKLEALGISPDFEAMAEALDSGRDRIVKRVSALQLKQAKRLAAIGTRLVKAGDAQAVADAVAGEGKPLVPFDEEAAAFFDESENLYDEGVSGWGDELDQQGVATAKPDAETRGRDRGLLRAAAVVAASLLADRVLGAWANETMRQLQLGTADPAALLAAMTGLSGKPVEALASERANVALATGRAAMAETNADAVDHYIVSCKLDGNSCGPCADWDGLEFPPGKEPRVPLEACEGREKCRCQVIAIAKGG